uniref:Protein Jumonji n=1 Tax=Lygus hesperus TaxID=30085 RepID=A0A0K8S2W9_LYGHE
MKSLKKRTRGSNKEETPEEGLAEDEPKAPLQGRISRRSAASGDNNPQEVIQGVQVKLQSTEGPEQKVIMKAKLVTKPSLNIPSPTTTSAPMTPAARKSTNEFPVPGTTARMVDAPTFYPTEKEFQDPLEYIEQITPQARSFGICRIVPPSIFKPECKVTDDMRFTAYNQYVHKMLYRWGPNVREMTAIKKYLATQCIALKQPPLIGGMEIDLPRLYQTVQSCGGLKEVIEKKRWAKVADVMKIPKAAQDRVTKLDDIYCKFLLPYDTLSHSERSKLLEEVDAEWTERERRIALEAERESKGEKEEKEENSESDEESDDGRDECMTKKDNAA